MLHEKFYFLYLTSKKKYEHLVYAVNDSRYDNGFYDIVELLIGKVADLNAQNMNGCSALFLAQNSGHDDIARLLFENVN